MARGWTSRPFESARVAAARSRARVESYDKRVADRGKPKVGCGSFFFSGGNCRIDGEVDEVTARGHAAEIGIRSCVRGQEIVLNTGLTLAPGDLLRPCQQSRFPRTQSCSIAERRPGESRFLEIASAAVAFASSTRPRTDVIRDQPRIHRGIAWFDLEARRESVSSAFSYCPRTWLITRKIV